MLFSPLCFPFIITHQHKSISALLHVLTAHAKSIIYCEHKRDIWTVLLELQQFYFTSQRVNIHFYIHSSIKDKNFVGKILSRNSALYCFVIFISRFEVSKSRIISGNRQDRTKNRKLVPKTVITNHNLSESTQKYLVKIRDKQRTEAEKSFSFLLFFCV